MPPARMLIAMVSLKAGSGNHVIKIKEELNHSPRGQFFWSGELRHNYENAHHSVNAE